MSRKKTEIHPVRAENVKKLLKREGITQKELAEKIGYSQQNISKIVQKKQPLTEEAAKLMIEAFPEKKYRIQWLLGYDEHMTLNDLEKDLISRSDATNNATIQLLDTALREVCARENIELPVLDNIPELLLLQAQLQDYADSLMWNYVKHRDHSHVWGYLDSIK